VIPLPKIFPFNFLSINGKVTTEAQKFSLLLIAHAPSMDFGRREFLTGLPTDI
jgi:hypothetical protein